MCGSPRPACAPSKNHLPDGALRLRTRRETPMLGDGPSRAVVQYCLSAAADRLRLEPRCSTNPGTRNGRGLPNFDNFTTAIDFHCGKLDGKLDLKSTP